MFFLHNLALNVLFFITFCSKMSRWAGKGQKRVTARLSRTEQVSARSVRARSVRARTSTARLGMTEQVRASLVL